MRRFWLEAVVATASGGRVARSFRTGAPVRTTRLAMVSLRCVSEAADAAVS